MEIVKHAEGVYEIKGFLDEALRNTFLFEARQEEGWTTTHIGNTTKKISEKLYREMSFFYKSIEALFTNIESMIYSFDLRRLKDSEFMWPHEDGGDPNDPRKIMFGIAIYLNDNFSGGELIYPDIGLSITPKAGSLVIHSAHLKHQVFPVVTGIRYSVTCFICGDESTKINMIS
jgi:Rps23 Pro-64 3,4-dihydroxylase Tpa1-like proline 4-hydroxylase